MALFNKLTIFFACVALGSASVAHQVVPAAVRALPAAVPVPAAYSVPYASSYSANVVNHNIQAPVAVQPNFARLAVAPAPVPVAQPALPVAAARLATPSVFAAPAPVLARSETIVSQSGPLLAQAGPYYAASAPLFARSAPFITAEYPGLARYANFAPNFAPTYGAAPLVNAW